VPPPSRTRRRRGSLTPELILDAAEAVAERGLDALSMRAVAASLGAAPMALYNHFATKEQLVDALLDRVLHRFEPAATTDDWVADLGAFARAHRRLLMAHTWAVATLVGRPSPGLGAVRIGEHALAILARGGYPPGPAVAAFSGIVALNYGWVSFTAAREREPEGPTADVTAMLSALPPGQFPHSAGAARQMGAYGSDDDYQLVLGALLGGLSGSTGG
jgi:AcrR family transcriptional regulator